MIIEKPEQEKNEVLLKSMKCLEYLIRFIVKSRELHAELTQRSDQHEFQSLFQGVIIYLHFYKPNWYFWIHLSFSFKDLLDNITIMMQCSSMNALTSQGTCIKYLPAIVPHVTRVFPETQLSYVSCKYRSRYTNVSCCSYSFFVVAWWLVEY